MTWHPSELLSEAPRICSEQSQRGASPACTMNGLSSECASGAESYPALVLTASHSLPRRAIPGPNYPPGMKGTLPREPFLMQEKSSMLQSWQQTSQYLPWSLCHAQISEPLICTQMSPYPQIQKGSASGLSELRQA